MTRWSPDNGPSYSGQAISDIFHEVVQRLLHDNIELAISDSLGAQRNIEILHLIDYSPQHRLEIDYHAAYQSFDTERQVNIHSLFLANPWHRSRRTPAHESRHYFDGGDGLVVREDSRLLTRKFEFLRGNIINPLEAENIECAEALINFYDDTDRIQRSKPLRPMTLLFNHFARIK